MSPVSERRARATRRHREWKGGYRPYDLVKEASHRARRGAGAAAVRADDPVLLAGRASRARSSSWSRTDPVDFVTTADQRARRHERHRPATGRRTTTTPTASTSRFIYPQKWLGVSHPIDTAQDFVLAPLQHDHRAARRCRAAVAAYQAAPGQAAGGLDRAPTTNGARQGHGRPRRHDHRSRPAATGPCRSMMDGAARVRPERRARRRAADQQAVLPDRLHQAAAVHGRRRRARQPRRSRAPARRPVGHDERDRQLPGPGVAVAVHVLVSDQAVLDLGQRRHPGDGASWACSAWPSCCVPFIPGVRDIPRWIPIYKLIWREHYRSRTSGS